MPDPISSVKGVSPQLNEKLAQHNIRTVDQFLEAAKSAASRRSLAGELGVDGKDLLELVNRADLSRVKGIGGVYADMLEIAGVDSVKELAHRKPENLHEALVKINSEQKLSGHAPTLNNVEQWVTEAKDLPKIVEY